MSAFNGVKVFCATLVNQRQQIGEQVTRWLDNARKTKLGFELVDIVVAQSSDAEFHCISIVITFTEDVSAPHGGKHRG